MTKEEISEQMGPFWDRVGEMLTKHNVWEYVTEQDIYGKDFETPVSRLVLSGYLEIEARGIIWRSVPADVSDRHMNVKWVSWEPFEIIGHFSTLTDPHATIKWVSHKGGQDEQQKTD